MKLGKLAAARDEYGKAVRYNVHLKAALDALRSLPA
jgi:hypothetical protein